MADLLGQLEALATSARASIAEASDGRALEDLRVRFLGKKGELSAVLRGMGQLRAEDRPKVGEAANRVRDDVEALLAGAKARVEAAKLEAELRGPPIDVSLPGRALLPRGHAALVEPYRVVPSLAKDASRRGDRRLAAQRSALLSD